MALVVTHTSVCPEYFKNEMDMLELHYIIEEINNKYKSKWEQVRWIGFATFRAMTGKPNSPNGVMVFPWEQNSEVVESDKVDTNTVDLNQSAIECGNFLNSIMKDNSIKTKI